MTVTKNLNGVLRRTGHAIGRFWIRLANAAVPEETTLHGEPARDYHRFPLF